MVLMFLGIVLLLLKYTGSLSIPLWVALVPFFPAMFNIGIILFVLFLGIVFAICASMLAVMSELVLGIFEAVASVVRYLTGR